MAVVYSSQAAEIGGLRVFTDPFIQLWRHRNLLNEMVLRDLSARFKGSTLGWAWAVLGPLALLLIYTAVFTNAVLIGAEQAFGERALSIFIGLILFNFCAEIWTRAPALLHEHAPFLKKSIMPSELLAWAAVARSITYALISLVVLLVVQFLIRWTLPITIVFVPLMLAPLAILFVGYAWFLAALGSFTRDLAYLMATIVPIIMFASPIFYQWSDVPPGLRGWLYLNPITAYINCGRALALDGTAPALIDVAVMLVSAVAYFVIGWIVFRRYKNVAIDAI